MSHANENYSYSSALGFKSHQYLVPSADTSHKKQLETHFTKQILGSTTASRANSSSLQNVMSGGYRQTSAMKPGLASASAAALPRADLRPEAKTALTLRPSSSHKDLISGPYASSARSTAAYLQGDHFHTKGTYLPQQYPNVARALQSIPYSSYQSAKTITPEYSRNEIGTTSSIHQAYKAQVSTPVMNNPSFANYLHSNQNRTWNLSPNFTAVRHQANRQSSMLAFLPQNFHADRAQMERSPSSRPQVIISHEEQSVLNKLHDFVESQIDLDLKTYQLQKRKILSDMQQPARTAELDLDKTEEQNRELDVKIAMLNSQLKELEEHFTEVGDYFNAELTLARLAATHEPTKY